jgi:hypothetical protein
MYDDYTTLFENLRESLPGEAVDILQSIFTQCRLPLSHDGPIDTNFRTPAVLDETTAGSGGCAIYSPANTLWKTEGDAYFGGKVTFKDTSWVDLLPVHAVIQWAGAAADVPNKWAIMDGTANSVANGGSGIDMTGHVVKGKASGTPDNTPAGANTHGHTSSTADSNTTGITTGNNAGGVTANTNTGDDSALAVAGVTVDSHGSHSHPITSVAYGASGTDVEVLTAHDPSTGNESAVLTHTVGEPNGTGHKHDIEHDHTVDAHNHPITDSGHPHNLTVTTGNNEPLNKQLYFIEKIAA